MIKFASSWFHTPTQSKCLTKELIPLTKALTKHFISHGGSLGVNTILTKITLNVQQQRFQGFFGAESPAVHALPLVALALHADGTLAYCLPGLEPGGGDDNAESMEDDSALESDDDVVIVYERLVQG